MPNGQSTLKIPSPWSQLALYFALLGAFLIVTPIALRLCLGDMKDPRTVVSLRLEQVISSIVFFGGAAYFSSRMTFRERPFYHLGLRRAHSPAFYPLALLVILASAPLYFWLGQINKGVAFPSWVIDMENSAQSRILTLLKPRSATDIGLDFFILAFLPALVEEACFRGALQRILIQGFKSPWKGILVTAAIFSFIHFQFLGFLPRMFLGMVLGLLYWYSGSLWVSILAHFFTNAAQLVMVFYIPQLEDKDPVIPSYIALISLVIVVGLLFIVKRNSVTKFVVENESAD